MSDFLDWDAGALVRPRCAVRASFGLRSAHGGDTWRGWTTLQSVSLNAIVSRRETGMC